MPPEPIHDVLNAVLRLFGNYDTSWNAMKKFLAQKGIIESILNFDPRHIKQDTRKDLKQFIKEKSSSFDKNVIYRASSAAGPLAEWVKAIVEYSKVLEEIQPLEQNFEKIKSKLDSQKVRLEKCEEQLSTLANKVVELKDNFAKKTSEAEILKTELKKAEKTLESAKNLLDKLGDEKVRWQEQVNTIESHFKSLPTDCLIASSIIFFLSKFINF